MRFSGRYEKNNVTNKALKVLISVVFCILFLYTLSGCSTTKYIPVEKVRDSIVYVGTHDTTIITKHDSIERWRDGDTIRIYEYKYLDKLVIKNDTTTQYVNVEVPVIKEVETTKEVVPTWCWIMLAVVVVFIIYKVVRIAIKIYGKVQSGGLL